MKLFDDVFDFDGDGVVSPFEELMGFSLIFDEDDDEDALIEEMNYLDIFGEDD